MVMCSTPCKIKSTRQVLGELSCSPPWSPHIVSITHSYVQGLIGGRALVGRSKFPKQIKSDEAGDDSRCVRDLKWMQTGRRQGIRGNRFHFRADTWDSGVNSLNVPQDSSRSAGGRRAPRKLMLARWLQSGRRTSTAHHDCAPFLPAMERESSNKCDN